MTLLRVGLIDVGVDLVLPKAEDGGVLIDESDVVGLAIAKALALLVAKSFEHDVALEGLLSLIELLGKLVKGLLELILGFFLALFPLVFVVFDGSEHGVVDVVNESLEDSHSVLSDLTKQNLLVAGSICVDRLAGLSVTEEIDSLSNQLGA